MNYPPDFLEKAKKAFPEFTNLHDWIEQGLQFAGYYINERIETISADVIAQKIESGKIDELKAMADSILLQQEFYRDWWQLSKQERGEDEYVNAVSQELS